MFGILEFIRFLGEQKSYRPLATEVAEKRHTRKYRKETSLTVAQNPIDVTLVPESTQIVPGIENQLHVFATDPLGAPYAEAAVEVTIDSSKALQATTDAYGHASVSWTPTAVVAQTLQVAVTTADGLSISLPFDFSAHAGDEHVIVRTDKSVYEVGEFPSPHSV